MAKTGAVRKGGLLRGKVSQGRPHPLSMAFRCEGQALNKKDIAEREAESFFPPRQSVGMMGTALFMVWHAVRRQGCALPQRT